MTDLIPVPRDLLEKLAATDAALRDLIAAHDARGGCEARAWKAVEETGLLFGDEARDAARAVLNAIATANAIAFAPARSDTRATAQEKPE